MAETARLAVFHGTGRPFEIREYPVPDPEPGAMLIKIARTHSKPEIRREAIFWLGRTGDERALAFLEELLSK